MAVEVVEVELRKAPLNEQAVPMESRLPVCQVTALVAVAAVQARVRPAAAAVVRVALRMAAGEGEEVGAAAVRLAVAVVRATVIVAPMEQMAAQAQMLWLNGREGQSLYQLGFGHHRGCPFGPTMPRLTLERQEMHVSSAHTLQYPRLVASVRARHV